MTVLHIDSSARTDGSVTRQLSAAAVRQIGGPIIRRDLSAALPHLTEAWVSANFTPTDARDATQTDTLALSDALASELKEADVIVIGAPLYNFGIPAALRAWIDLVARAGLTFRYTETGPVGLLEGKRAVIVTATGGTAAGSEADFATGYLRHFLGFLGISDVEIIAADQMMITGESALERAQDAVAALSA